MSRAGSHRACSEICQANALLNTDRVRETSLFRNRCHVPEWLLGAWRIDVDPSLSDTPPHRTWLARARPGGQSVEHSARSQIGRASCRARVGGSVGAEV